MPVVDPDVDDLDDVGVAQVHQRADLQVEPLQEGGPERLAALPAPGT